MVRMGGLGCGGLFVLLCFITLIVILTNIYNLGSEDQVVVETKYERTAYNGPQNVLLNPFREKWERKATWLGPRDYAVVKERQGLLRHEEGPNQLFLGAWDELVSIQPKIVLQRLDYIRLIDQLTGYERVVNGPELLTPGPQDTTPEGTETAVIVAPDTSIVVLNRTYGLRKLITESGPFFPKAYEDIIEIRRAIPVGEREYVTIKNIRQGNQSNIPGPMQVNVDAYDELNCTGVTPPNCVRPKIVLELNQYVRLVDEITGLERVETGPMTVMPSATEATEGVEKAVYIVKTTTVRLRNNTFAWVYPERGAVPTGPNPGIFTPDAYEYIDKVVESTVLDARKYAIVENYRGAYVHYEGPMLLRLTARDKLIEIRDKILLQKDEYVRLLDYRDGIEEVVTGPKLVVPTPTQLKNGGADPPIQQAVFLDSNTALLVLNKSTGIQSLVQAQDMYLSAPQDYYAYTPQAYEYIVDTRTKFRALPYQAFVYRSATGQMEFKYPGDTFFLPAYASFVEMYWSDYSSSADPPGSKKLYPSIDLRTKQSFFSYTVRTRDNILLDIRGSAFWQINDVSKMMGATANPSADVWQHARSALITVINRYDWQYFTENLASVVAEAYTSQTLAAGDDFYDRRGIDLQSLEVVSFDCVDPIVSEKLQDIIQETVNRINAMVVQDSALQLEKKKMEGQIILEGDKKGLLEIMMNNTKLIASTEGKRQGVLDVSGAVTFIKNLSASVASENDRIELYKIRQQVLARNSDTQAVSQMDSTLFLNPADMNMNLGSIS